MSTTHLPKAKSKLPATIAIGCAALFWICCSCGVLNAIVNPSKPRPTRTAINPPATQIQNPILPQSTSTLAPLIEIPPTATIFIFTLQTDVAQPTEYIYSTNTPFTLATQELQATSPSSSSCDPSYPDVCINGNPRLNCAELRAINIFHFRVLPPDPLDYDKDQDGIGCE